MIFTFIFAFSVQGAWLANSNIENEQVAEVATMSSASSIISTASSAFSSASATRRLTHLPELVPLSERQEEPRCSVAIQNNTGQFEQDWSGNLDLIYCYTRLWPFLEKKRLFWTNFHISYARVHNVVHIIFLTYKSNTQTKKILGLGATSNTTLLILSEKGITPPPLFRNVLSKPPWTET